MDREDPLLGKWISILHRYRKNYVNKQLASIGISGSQFIILLVLSRHDGISQEEITENLKTDKTNTAKSIKKLEMQGYIARQKNQDDRRAYHVFLTEKAWQIIPLIRRTVRQWEKETTRGLSEEECRSLEKALHKMADNAGFVCGICESASGR